MKEGICIKIKEIIQKEPIIGIYKINYPNNKVYIGLSNNIKRRIIEHWDKDDGQPSHFALLKYYNSKDEIDFDILEQIKDLDYATLSELEKYWIKFYNSNDKKYGYNITSGGINLTLSDNPFSKINEKDLKMIIEMLKQGKTNIEIGECFNLHPDSIGRINTGKRYYDNNLQYPIRESYASTKDIAKNINSKNRIPEEIVLKVIYDLKESTKTNSEIGKIYDISINTVTAINTGKHSNCPIEIKYPIRENKRVKKNFSQEEIKEICKLLLDKNYSMTEIGKLYNCSRDLITDINQGKRYSLPEYSYPIRTFYPKRKSKNKKPVSTIRGSAE